MESSRNHFVPSHFPETSHQGLHALSLVEFICSHYPSNFVHVVEAKSEVFTADKAEHSLVKVVIVLLKEVERHKPNEGKEHFGTPTVLRQTSTQNPNDLSLI